MEQSNNIPNTLFVRNRKNFASQMAKNSIAVFTANEEMPRNGDQCFPFRQNSDFFYLTGIDREGAALVEMIRKHIGVDTLKFNTIDNICNAIGMPKCNICTHCFDGSSYGDK